MPSQPLSSAGQGGAYPQGVVYPQGGVASPQPQGAIPPQGAVPPQGAAYPQGAYPATPPAYAPTQYPPTAGQQPYAPYGQPPYEYPPLTPQKPPKRKRSLASRILFWVLLVVMVGALSFLGYIMFTYWHGQQVYEEVAVQAQVKTDTEDLAAFNVDWDALRAINPDVVAWIYVPDTTINYPVCWRENDTEYYLWHNFNGDTSPQFGAEYGCPALSGANSPDFSDDINIISGHNLFNGEMFSPFASFNDTTVFNEHRIIYLLTPDANYRLKTFAVDYVNGHGTVPIRFKTQAEMHEFIQQCIDNTLVDANPGPPAADTIARAFAFYTCDNSNDVYRFFIYAYVDDYLPLTARAEGIMGQAPSDADAAAVNDATQERTEDGAEDADESEPADEAEGLAA